MRSLPEIFRQNETPPDWARDRKLGLNTFRCHAVGRYAWEPEHNVGRCANPYTGSIVQDAPSRLNTSKRARLTMDAEGIAVPFWTPETLAKAWQDAPHEPRSNTWKAYVSEIDYLAETWEGNYPTEIRLEEPYNSASAMRTDWYHSGRLLVASSFGLSWEDEHPLNAFARGPGKWTHYRRNFWARAIHDLVGHIETDNPFGFVGELLAYRAESQRFPVAAYPALFAEVVGQAAYHEVYGRFPDTQKCAVIEPRRMLI